MVVMRARIPFGYQIRNGRAEPDPTEAPQLKLLFELYIIGYSAAFSAREACIPRTAACCRKMLSNPIYCGTDYYPQLITPTQMEAAEKRRHEKDSLRKNRPGRKPCHPLPVQMKFSLSELPALLPDDPSDLASVIYRCIHTEE